MRLLLSAILGGASVAIMLVAPQWWFLALWLAAGSGWFSSGSGPYDIEVVRDE